MAEFYAGCATAEEMLLARDVLMFFGCQVAASIHMDSAAARKASGRSNRGKCERCGYNRRSKRKHSHSKQ